MAFSWIFLVVALLHFLFIETRAKVIAGVVSSGQAWSENGTFITKFCFHDRRALFEYETNISSNGRWYFYLDDHWSDSLAETDCRNKIAKARFSVGISATRGQQLVNQWLRPHFWYVVYADPNTCDESPPTEDLFIGYTLTFLNPDSEGNANDHFGEDEKGLLTMYTLLILFYIGGIAYFARRVWQSIQKGGPMHEVLQVLSVAIAVHFLSAFFMFINLWIFKNDGEGSSACETLSEILDVVSQMIMICMLLSMSMGWTLGQVIPHPVNNKGQLGIIALVGGAEVILVLWEQSYEESHYTYHVHENLPGFLLVCLRIILAVLFGYNLQSTLSKERSTLRKDFYQAFAIICYLWFLSFPMLMLIAMVLPEYWRHRVVTIGTIAIQLVALMMLSKQFLSRSLYWEVSTLSSTTLPFKRDRGGFRD
ncbi:PREDICTED: integral membrane protein GPR180-like [Amphimedon queenslandica]|uniref:Uncharacterized protein n=1 Tax=Amphimedon queenslandica TaxID=400682 RepID=A0A1X7VM06_AMPQE|nr:PREDICTED: integral membrane protein GPR180-like [Amphimedon queenslandica]|eukprot:XP_019864220.1 PREDICTED: integral membrane protein GPR180-like [Amphimedon queenslandica]